MKNLLAPSLLAADFAWLGSEVATLERAGAHYLHIDVMDGCFVPDITIGAPVVARLRPHSGCVFDVHLMVAHPLAHLARFAEVGADILCVHQESADDAFVCLRAIRALGKQPAVALNPGTSVEAAHPFAHEADMILLMSVQPGRGGQPIKTETLRKAEQLAGYIAKHNLNTRLEMDGGINLGNLQSVLDAGVNVVVAGTAIFGATAKETEARVRAFLEILQG